MRTHLGRTVLITGAGQGIGAALAAGFLSRGAAVGLLDIAPEHLNLRAAELNKAGARLAAAVADVADHEAVTEAVERLSETLGATFDVVVCNAGISPKHEGRGVPMAGMDPAEWRRVVDVNLTGTFNVVHATVPQMIATGYGRIITIASVAGRTYFPHVGAHYAASKSAVIGFTKHLAGELGPHGITVNALAPGRITTSLIRTVSQQVNDEVVAATPLGRLGEPEEVAEVALFLTSDAARFVTGQVIDVAGGWLMT
ncbi:MAG: SDR family oxidoreductase [Rhodospirillaceae bacterium]|nr:SDR family oxidoreductase [Rhodospirillaceae bacterium]MCA8933279.1 SDR family oxidoreductase [Rhodospirillaceae bacterium]